MQANTAVKPNLWLDRMFQMRFGMFMVIVAGFALVCWAVAYYQANIDIGQSMFHQQIADLSSPDPKVRRAAAYALDGILVAQLPEGGKALMQAMRDIDPLVRSAAMASLSTSLMHYYAVTNGQVPPERDAASLGFIAALRDKDPRVRFAASQGLVILSQSTLLKSGKVGSLGIDPTVATDPLIKTLDDPDATTALLAYRALENLYSMTPAVTTGSNVAPANIDLSKMQRTLRRLARESNRDVRVEAVPKFASTLREQGEPPDEILAILATEKEVKVRIVVERALRQPISPQRLWRQSDTIAHALARWLSTSDSHEHFEILSSLSTLASIPDDLVPPLIQLLDSEIARVDEQQQVASGDEWRQWIVDLLPNVILKASPTAALSAIPSLSRAAWTQKGSSVSAATAIATLAAGSKEARALIPRIMKQFDETNVYQDKVALAQTLGMFGPDATEAAELLLQAAVMPGAIEFRPAPSTELRTAACLALIRIGPDAKFAVPTLSSFAERLMKLQMFPTEVFDAILTLDPNSADAADQLMRIAEFSEASERGNSSTARAYLNKVTRYAVADNPTLRKLVDSPDPELRARARDILRRFERN